ncbi:hypothetical protein [Streptomyces sp. NPDC050804]|uniref:hypothetical protein n=1 Tax=unclassified Streptomyces TaxID=2593676 RepID=UPI00343CCFF7|nr:hypothetical protein OG214_03020 [Streptomyces sp. NBC_00872]
MEQHTDPKILPTHPAGTDPAYVPGLLPSHPVGVDEADENAPAPEPTAVDTPPEDSEDAVPGEKTAGSAEGKVADSEAVTPAEEEQEDDGPVFEASDRRGVILADHAGIRFRLDGEEADFDWEEIKAVETDVPRFGRRFGITVYTSSQRWFQHDVEGSSREQLKKWAAELDEVLDARFDDTEG